jgi:hypothetical protein
MLLRVCWSGNVESIEARGKGGSAHGGQLGGLNLSLHANPMRSLVFRIAQSLLTPGFMQQGSG